MKERRIESGSDGMELIVTENLTKVYSDDGVPVEALKEVSIAFGRGEFTAVAGPSGSGKTTLLNLISGLDVPTSGHIWLEGKLLEEMSARELSDFRRDHVGFIFQAYNLIPVLNVEENVEYVLLLRGVERDRRKELVGSILAELGLSGFEKRLPPTLSGGQQQRVAIARAMVSGPALVLADEPTANLDSRTGKELLETMKELNRRKGVTFIFSTHDDMVMEQARRLVVLKDGRVAADEERE